MNKEIKKLLLYGMQHNLFTSEDEIYCRNLLLAILQRNEYEDEEIVSTSFDSCQPMLDAMLSYAIEHGIIEDTMQSKDTFDTRIMNALMPRPSEIIREFEHRYKESAKCAMDYYYGISTASNYVRVERIAKDQHWVTNTEYGDIDITINLSKPEKDPKDIAKAKLLPSSKYPKCLLCKENEGYAGTISHPARHNHRIIPIELSNTKYFLQYSPYAYYPEHCIVFNEDHIPMVINEKTFACLLDFVEQFPHYFIGSNADLPIVGGSILTHDHFQGGNYTFPMALAPQLEERTSKEYPEVCFGRILWPLSVLRLKSKNKQALISFAKSILTKWKTYSDEDCEILAYSGDVPHNTITPIARYRDGQFELDLTLRNNRTSDEHPDGIFHPHAHLHHIKKENIGLIEVMGLAVLPSRLKEELEIIETCILEQTKLPSALASHLPWMEHLQSAYHGLGKDDLHSAIQKEVGLIFQNVLENSGVYKQTKEGQEGFLRFIQTLED